MKKFQLLTIFLVCTLSRLSAQTPYFPPLIGNTWDTISPLSLGWCPDKIDSLENYLAQKNTKAFIVLKQGKIAIEKYFGTFTKDSIWYWASASKSLTGFLTGIAQEENFLNIQDTVSRFLGNGWTICPPAKERLITIRNQITMTSGLDENVPDDFCTIDTCLSYLADAGTRWAYHNAPYHLVQDVIANASGLSYNSYTNSRIKSKTGMQGFWYDYIFYSRARDMARFGLLIQNKGVWSSDTLLHDTAYFEAMLTSSQNLNLSYGYLWWLNGKSSFMLPQSQMVFQSTLIPNAPADAVAALGKNDQKVYVVPSLDLVVIRMGNASGTPLLAVSGFDNELWGKLNDVFCNANFVSENKVVKAFTIFPNPVIDKVEITLNANQNSTNKLQIYDCLGSIKLEQLFSTTKIELNTQSFGSGLYFVRIGDTVQKLVIKK